MKKTCKNTDQKKNQILIISMMVLLLIPGMLSSQVSRSMYFQRQLPGANILNPTFHPAAKFYINLPVISSFYLGFESPFSFEQLTNKWESGDTLYIDRDKLLGILNERNYFSFELYNELGRVGFGSGRHYFHASIAKIFSTKFAFEKEMMALVLFGNASEQFFGKNLQLSRTGLNMTSFHEFSLGYSFMISEKVTLGTRLKYLNGAFNIWTKKAEINFYTDTEPNFPITASTDILLKTSSTISDFDNLIDQVEGYKWFDLTGNHGYGFDLGLDFRPSENYSLSVSVVDFGWINWKENVKNYKSAKPGKEFIFSGFDIVDFIQDGSFSDSIDFLDTITEHFRLEKDYEAYTSHLNPKVYLGGLWRINKSNEVGAMVRTDFIEERIQPSLTLNYTHRFGNWASVYGNYSILASAYTNIGFGFSAKFGPVQIYILNDIAYAIVRPREARNYNFHFGMNFLFGTPKEASFKGIPKKDNSSDGNQQ